jgi:hypothetical protein
MSWRSAAGKWIIKTIRDVELELEAIRFSRELEEAAKRNAE